MTSVLLLIAGTRHCSFGVMNSLTKELVEFGYCTAGIGEIDYASFFEEQETLKKKYTQAALAYDVGESVLIPPDFYHHDDLHLHLNLIHGHKAHTAVIAEHLLETNLYNAYRIPAGLHSAVIKKFINGKSWHILSVMLENTKEQEPAVIAADFKTDEVSVIVLKNNRVLLARSFSYSTPEDILYFLLKCCRQLNLLQQEVKLVLSGFIEKDSVLYRELYKYFLHLEFDGLYGQVKPADELTIHPEHYYSSISKLAACVS